MTESPQLGDGGRRGHVAGDDRPFLVALLSLPGMGPVRLRQQLAERRPTEAWSALLAGEGVGSPERVSHWSRAASSVDVEALWRAHASSGVEVLAPGDERWPSELVDDPEPPPLLFLRGDPAVLERPRVAVVGTRRCTSSGRAVAFDLGADLAEAGVCVVSGLALGVDGAAHRGVLEVEGAPLAVVGSGVDVVYPRAHRQLWHDVAARGAVLSEFPLGTHPERWHFPARNRIIAALSAVVVVVESHAGGGSMHTVESALERDRVVMAVPGSVRSPASAGTNALLVAGAAPARDATDVLVALGIRATSAGGRSIPVTPPTGDAGKVLDAVGWGPCTLEEIADRCGAPLGPVAVHLASLERDGWISQGVGWYERVR